MNVSGIGAHMKNRMGGSTRNCNYKGTMMTYEMFELFLARDKVIKDYADYMAHTIANIKAADAKIIARAKAEGLDMSKISELKRR